MGWNDIIKKAAVDAFQSVAENSVIPLGVVANLTRLKKDPFDSLTNITGLFVPPVSLASALMKIGGPANVSGAGNTPIIAAGLAMLKQMHEDCGTGTPDDGSGFGHGANAFQQIDGMFQQTSPPGSWRGAASDGYGHANDEQRARSATMADVDASVAKTLAKEASQVADTREAIDNASTFLNGCIPMALMLAAVPEVGDALTYGFQIQSVAAAMVVPTAKYQGLTLVASHTATAIGAAVGLYTNAASTSSTAPQANDGEVGVDTHDLRYVSGQQHQIAQHVESAGNLTEGEPKSVAESHGKVCAATSAAVTQAEAARKSAADTISKTSGHLADSLSTAADRYDRADELGRQKMEDQVPHEAPHWRPDP